MIKIAQIGCGYWGPNLLRNFISLSNVEISCVAEMSKERRNYLKEKYPNLNVVSDYNQIFSNPTDAVVIATPAESHYQLAKEMLSNGKHCLVEKPLALKASEAKELIELAKEKDRVLMVGHTFLFNAAVRRLKEEVKKGTLGRMYYVYSQRLNLGRVRTDVNVMWNLAPHDISILLYVLNENPVWISAYGERYIQDNIEDVVFLTVGFESGVIANIHVSWLDPNKVRRMTFVGSKKMIVYDDVEKDKIQIFDKGIDKKSMDKTLGEFDSFGEFQLIKRAGNVVSPSIDFDEPLAVEAEHFVECIKNKKKPISDGYNGLMVTKILETATKSINKEGKRIELD
ncbi:MAG: Gfo/Idh/MocA family oxidoreductase [Candidatus Aminicenantaceae bacterium]